MALSNVTFQISQDGLGTVAQNDDNKSALFFDIAAPTAYGVKKIKAYNAIEQIVADGMTQVSVVFGLVYYHAKEFWRQSPNATLWLAFNLTDADEFHTETGGKVRQIGATIATIAAAQSTWQTFANAIAQKFSPVEIVCGYQPAVTPALGDLPDLGATLVAPNVSILIAGDHVGSGAALAGALGKTYLPATGAVLGLMSLSKVNENIGWVAKYNLSNGLELEKIRLVDGSESNDPKTLQVDDKRFLTLRKYVGFAGTFVEDDKTATIGTSDYASIRNNRTIQKAIRNCRTRLLPLVKSPVYVDATTGQLQAGTVQYFEDTAAQALKEMQKAQEISGFKALVNPAQNVLSTSKIYITLKVIPVGSAKEIIVKIGLDNPVNF